MYSIEYRSSLLYSRINYLILKYFNYTSKSFFKCVNAIFTNVNASYKYLIHKYVANKSMLTYYAM